MQDDVRDRKEAWELANEGFRNLRACGDHQQIQCLINSVVSTASKRSPARFLKSHNLKTGFILERVLGEIELLFD